MYVSCRCLCLCHVNSFVVVVVVFGCVKAEYLCTCPVDACAYVM